MLYVRKVPQNECWGKKSRRHKTMCQGPHLTPGLFVCLFNKVLLFHGCIRLHDIYSGSDVPAETLHP